MLRILLCMYGWLVQKQFSISRKEVNDCGWITVKCKDQQLGKGKMALTERITLKFISPQ